MQRTHNLILASFLLLLATLKGQNLVPNSSFETPNSCPSNNIFTAANWFNPNTASPDYFNPCGTGSTVPPNVLFGPQSAHTGSCFAGGGWYSLGGGFYDYMQVQLSSSLTAGTVYSVSMWVALASGVMYASNDIGIYISTGTFKSSGSIAASTSYTTPTSPAGFGVFNTFTPQITTNGNFITSTSWTQIGGTYTATGGENAITLGCFKSWTTTGTLVANASGNGRCYYYYDDVSMVAMSAMTVAPTQPLAVVGPTSTCGASTAVFSVAAVAGATAYTWALPVGWTGASTTNTISVITNTTSGTLSVTADNAFGSSPSQTLNVTVNNVSATVTQTGSTLYANAAGSYTWVDCNNSNSVITSGSASFTPSQSGSYAVIISVNGCTATSACNNILVVPAQPGAISGSTVLCSGATQVYSIPAVPNATSYAWSLPSDWSGVSVTNSIAVTVNSASGTLSVTANNQAGASSAQTLNIAVNSVTASVIQTGSTLYANTANTYQWLDCNNNYSVVASGSASYTPAQSGSYAVLISVSGCTAVSACNSVQLIPAQPGSISGAATLCAGSVQIFSVAAVPGATSYSWTLPSGWSGASSTNSIALTVSSASGTLTVTANNQAGASLPQQLSITVNLVNAVITQSANVLYTSNAGSYQWVDCNMNYSVLSTVTSSYAPSQSGSYAVVVSANGCADTSACLQVSILTVGLASVLAENPLSVFPNPADQHLFIKAKTGNYPLTISVRDYTGRLVYAIEVKSEEALEIATNNWMPGVYTLQLESPGQRATTQKLIISR